MPRTPYMRHPIRKREAQRIVALRAQSKRSSKAWLNGLINNNLNGVRYRATIIGDCNPINSRLVYSYCLRLSPCTPQKRGARIIARV